MQISKKFRNIANHYNTLINMANNHFFVGITNEWIVDNYYLLVEKKSIIKSFYKNNGINKYAAKNVNLYKVILEILQKYNYKVDDEILIKEFTDFQRNNNFVFIYEEIDVIPIVSLVLLITKVSDICTREALIIKERKKIDDLIDKLKTDIINYPDLSLADYFEIKGNTSNYSIVYFNEQLKELGTASNLIFKQLDDLLKNSGRS
jgi:hypothetical protein